MVAPLPVEQGREVHAVHRGSADGDQLRHLGPVAGEDRDLDPQVLELLGQERHFAIVVGGIDEIGLAPLQGGNLGAEILVAGLDITGGDNLAAPALEFLLKKLGQADAVVLGLVDEHRHAPGLEVFVGEPGGHLALEIVYVSGPKGVGAVLGHQGAGGGGRDIGDFRPLGDGHPRQGIAADHFADDGRHLVLLNEAAHGVGRFDPVAPGVHQDQLHGLPQHLGLEFMGHLHPFPDHLAHGRGRPGHGEI